MIAFDGNKNYQLKAGDYCIARKNHLVRYTKFKNEGLFEKIIIVFDEPFLRKFIDRNTPVMQSWAVDNSFLFIEEDKLINNFILSLGPYYNTNEQIDDQFSYVKREELLLILLRNNPKLTAVFFNFAVPQKIDLEEFMNRNFRFNISMERFAFLTGRSLSTFKRDFQKVFSFNPGQWLTKKRLDEAYFLLKNEKQKPTEVYLNVGFEDLSHFSFAFKKQFGIAPSELNLE
ncbi:AraC family transcriptional regulator [Flavobacterium sp. ST-87]|uniref:AraC family transcriptional regulator n=2 Tax=Flavobacteriaceae TaxID=49546 RepID=A0ABW8XUV9_9FLAO